MGKIEQEKKIEVLDLNPLLEVSKIRKNTKEMTEEPGFIISPMAPGGQVLNDDQLLNEWAEKIYRLAEEAYKELIKLRLFEKEENWEKFRGLMHEKKFGKFVSVFKDKTGLYVKIGNYELGIDYYPCHHHISQIKKFLI